MKFDDVKNIGAVRHFDFAYHFKSKTKIRFTTCIFKSLSFIVLYFINIQPQPTGQTYVGSEQ